MCALCVCKRDTTIIYLLVRSLVSNDLIKKLLWYVDKKVSQFLFTRARDKIPALSKKLSTSTFVRSLCMRGPEFVLKLEIEAFVFRSR